MELKEKVTWWVGESSAVGGHVWLEHADVTSCCEEPVMIRSGTGSVTLYGILDVKECASCLGTATS